MNDYQNLPIHYVYKQCHPKTGKCFYVGHGRHERAWRCSTSGDEVNYGHRNKDHSEYLFDLQLEGYIPTDWVHIVAKGLTKTEACKIEQELIRELRPTYNKPMGLSLLTLKGKSLEKAQRLRKQGLFYNQIAEEIGSSTMTVWRALNGKNKNSG